MPTTFPQYDPETDTLVPREYYSVAEVAELLHVSESYVYQRCREGAWDALRVTRHYHLSAAQVGAAVDAMQSDGAGREPEDEPVQLGVPVADPDLESLR